MNELTKEQKQACDDMVTRRMQNTGESRNDAIDHVVNYLQGLAVYIEQKDA